MIQKSINVSATGDAIILQVSTGNINYIYDYCFVVGGAVTAILKDEGTTEFARYGFTAAGQQMNVPPIGPGVNRFTAVGDLIINLSAGASVTGHFTYEPGR